MANTAIHNVRHIISNLQSQFLLIFPYKREDMAIKITIINSPQFQFPNSSTTTTFFNQLATTLNVTALTNSGHLFLYSTKHDNKAIQTISASLIQHINATKTKKIKKNFNETCVLLFGFGVFLDDVSTKKHTKDIRHSIDSRIKYHMTHILTNNKCLKLGISLKFN